MVVMETSKYRNKDISKLYVAIHTGRKGSHKVEWRFLEYLENKL